MAKRKRRIPRSSDQAPSRSILPRTTPAKLAKLRQHALGVLVLEAKGIEAGIEDKSPAEVDDFVGELFFAHGGYEGLARSFGSELSPSDAELADAICDLGHNEPTAKRRTRYLDALTLDRNCSRAWIELAETYNSPERSMTALTEAAAIGRDHWASQTSPSPNPSDKPLDEHPESIEWLEILTRLADLHTQQAHFDQAADIYREVLDYTSDDPTEARGRLIDLNLIQSNDEQAESLLAKYDEDQSARKKLGSLLWSLTNSAAVEAMAPIADGGSADEDFVVRMVDETQTTLRELLDWNQYVGTFLIDPSTSAQLPEPGFGSIGPAAEALRLVQSFRYTLSAIPLIPNVMETLDWHPPDDPLEEDLYWISLFYEATQD